MRKILYFARVYEKTDGHYCIERGEIKVLEESITEGASIPTYLVQYPDGRKARISKDMYFDSKDEADKALFLEVCEGIEQAQEDILSAEGHLNRLIALRSMIKE